MFLRAVHIVAVGCGLVAAASLPAQTPAQAPVAKSETDVPQELSPKAAYQQSMRPLERTRSYIGNWSDTEISALTVAMARAKAECDARDATSFAGEDLIDLAQLCSVGQEFANVEIAAQRYLAAEGEKPHATRAYADLLDAQLHLKQETEALATAQKMLSTVAYETLAADVIDETISYMQFVHTVDALTLSAAREPLLLARMKAVVDSSAPTQDSEPTQTLHELYTDGIAYAALQQLSGMPSADTVKALDAALPAQLAPDDAIPIAVSRKRFALLGKPLPKLMVKSYLSMPGTTPQLPAQNAVTGLLLFADWCAQCVSMGQRLPQTVFTVERHEAYLYGMMAATVPQHPQPQSSAAQPAHATFDPAEASNLLRETPTMIVNMDVLNDLTAMDVPFLVLTDSQGIVRVLQPVGEDALIPGGLIDSAIARVSERWPAPARTQTGAAPTTRH
jgi:hypothetical protein